MVKRILFLLLVLLSAYTLEAQTTNISATVTDSDATVWKNGTWSIVFKPNPQLPNPFIYKINGATMSPSVTFQSGTLSALGAMSATIYDNTQVTPVGSSWSLTVCPNASAPCGTYNFVASGPSMNLSSPVSAIVPAPRFQARSGAYGYNTAEAILQPIPGSTYYDVTQGCQNFFNTLTSTWTCPTGGGSGTVNSGAAKALAFYPGPGTTTTVGPHPVATIDPTTGMINASIFTRINPFMYGVVGDCITDDQPGITAALTAAMTYSSSNVAPACVEFPKPPGGCYLTSTIQYNGACMEGQPNGIFGIGQPLGKGNGVIIKGKPGQDILHGQDPTTTAAPFAPSPSIRNLTFMVDDSISTVGLFPHRFPGRWCTSSITSGTTAMTGGTSPAFSGCIVTCGDVGQAIKVTGAGPGGTDLVTTIASMPSCWAGSNFSYASPVTLAASASTTVTNARTYISVLGYPVTYTMGNAAIAFDNSDGNPADWVTNGVASMAYPKFENLNFSTTSYAESGQNGSIGFYTQGAWGIYGGDWKFINMHRFVWDVAMVCADINGWDQSCSNDYQYWDHLDLEGSANPWLSYNGLHNHVSNVQLATANGMEFLYYPNQFADGADDLFFENMGWEGNGGANTGGFRYNGNDGHFNGIGLSGTSPAYLDGYNITCKDCNWGVLNVNGAHNRIYSGGGDMYGSTINNGGRDNHVTVGYASNPLDSMQPGFPSTLIPSRNNYYEYGITTENWLNDGNVSTTYNYEDLLSWPTDLQFNTSGAPLTQSFVYDTNSPTGSALLMNSNSGPNNYFKTYPTGNNSPSINTHIPFGYVTAYASLECVGGTVIQIGIGNQSGSFISGQTITCSTTAYQTFSVRVRVDSSSTLVGFRVAYSAPVTSVKCAWAYLKPDVGTINGNIVPPFENSANGGQFVTGPQVSVLNHIPLFANLFGAIQDSGDLYPNTQNAAGGQCFNGFNAVTGVFTTAACSNGGSGSGFAGTVTYTTNHTLGTGDNGFLVNMACSAPCAVTLPNPQPSSTYIASVVSTGTSVATLTLGSSMTYNKGATTPTLFTNYILPIVVDSQTSTNYIGPIPPAAGLNTVLLPTSSALTIAQAGNLSCSEVFSGSGTGSALTTGDDAISNNTCYNDTGSTRIISAVKCRSNAASNTTTVNPTFGASGTGTTILSGALTCGSTYAYSASGTITNANWITGTGIDPGMGGTLTGTSISIIVEYHY